MKKHLFLLTLLCASNFSFSQTKNDLHISLELGAGAVIPEYQFVNALVQKNVQQVELSLLRKSYGSSFWQKLYKYPQFGCSVFFTTLGNQQVFGDELAVYPFVLFQSMPTKKFHITNKIGFGLGFATKRFELESNYQNIAVGSHLNAHFRYQLGMQYDLSKNSTLSAGINFHHFSNANMKEPNLGLNLVSGSLGLCRAISPQSERVAPETPAFSADNEFLFIASIGGKHTRALQSKVYLTSSFAFEMNRKLTHVFSFGTGLDLFYDASTETEMSVTEAKTFKPSYNYRTGIHIAQEFVYNKCSFILQEGIYLGLSNHVDHKLMYNKLIVRYKWSKHFCTQLAVKSQLHILDYPECGFSYYF